VHFDAQIGGLPLAIVHLTGRRYCAFASETFLPEFVSHVREPTRKARYSENRSFDRRTPPSET
jgi:hypothetical protein